MISDYREEQSDQGSSNTYEIFNGKAINELIELKKRISPFNGS